MGAKWTYSSVRSRETIPRVDRMITARRFSNLAFRHGFWAGLGACSRGVWASSLGADDHFRSITDAARAWAEASAQKVSQKSSIHWQAVQAISPRRHGRALVKRPEIGHKSPRAAAVARCPPSRGHQHSQPKSSPEIDARRGLAARTAERRQRRSASTSPAPDLAARTAGRRRAASTSPVRRAAPDDLAARTAERRRRAGR